MKISCRDFSTRELLASESSLSNNSANVKLLPVEDLEKGWAKAAALYQKDIILVDRSLLDFAQFSPPGITRWMAPGEVRTASQTVHRNDNWKGAIAGVMPPKKKLSSILNRRQRNISLGCIQYVSS